MSGFEIELKTWNWGWEGIYWKMGLFNVYGGEIYIYIYTINLADDNRDCNKDEA